MQLTSEQKETVRAVLSVGCDRETASHYIGRSVIDLTRAMRHDPEFSVAVRRAEASIELTHMKVVREVVKDVKNWRASVWWLERRSPERFAKRSPGTVTSRHLKAFLAIIGDTLNDNIRDAEDRERMIARFQEYTKLIDEMADDAWETAPSQELDASDPITEGHELQDCY